MDGTSDGDTDDRRFCDFVGVTVDCGPRTGQAVVGGRVTGAREGYSSSSGIFGSDEGKTVCSTSGVSDGMSEGMSEGYDVGGEDGLPVGLALGRPDVEAVGVPKVGLRLEGATSLSLLLLDGISDGARSATIEGTVLGGIDTTCDGQGVGIAETKGRSSDGVSSDGVLDGTSDRAGRLVGATVGGNNELSSPGRVDGMDDAKSLLLFLVGWIEFRLVGAAEGLSLGMLVEGFAVGVKVGKLVEGVADGDNIEELVMRVGLVVIGAIDGATEGSSLGALDVLTAAGLIVGSTVGTGDGMSLGMNEGALLLVNVGGIVQRLGLGEGLRVVATIDGTMVGDKLDNGASVGSN